MVLELEDRFTTGMARAAASAALLNKELNSLSNESVRTRRSMSDIDSGSQRIGKSAGASSREIDKLSGRVRILADAAAILGPSLIPIGAVGIPAMTGLAASLGVAGVAAGVTVLAFQGMGDALKTLNKAGLEPTKENLDKAQRALEGLPPSMQGFVAELSRLTPRLHELQALAAAGVLPGFGEGLAALEKALPRVENIVGGVAFELGTIGKNVGESLSSDRWAPFLDFVAAEAPKALHEMATAAGNTAHAVAELFISTNPLNNDFLDFLVRATADLDRWAEGLRDTQGFADFLAYVEQTGPKVADAFEAIAKATIQILQAASPLGGPVLQGITALANLVGAIANSDLGTPLFTAVTALSLYNRTISITGRLAETKFGAMVASEAKASLGVRTLIADIQALNAETNLSRATPPAQGFIGPLTRAQAAAENLRRTLPSLAKTGALLAGITVASTGAADKIGLTNTASLALAGTFVSPGWGTAIGGAIGATVDLAHANDDLEAALNRARLAARTGDFDQLTASTKKLKNELNDINSHNGFRDFVGDVGKNLANPLGTLGIGQTNKQKIESALADNASTLSARQSAAAQRLLADGFRATAAGANSAAQSARSFDSSLQALNDTLTGRASLRDYEQALDDFAARATKRAELFGQLGDAQRNLRTAKTAAGRESARNQIKSIRQEIELFTNTLDINTQAGRDNQAALDNIAATALKFAQTLTGVERTKFLAGARQQFVDAAKSAGLAQDAAEALATKVLGLKNIKGNIKIVVDADGAYRVIDSVSAKLRNLHKLNVLRLAVNLIPLKGDTPGFDQGGYTGAGPRLKPAGIVHASEVVLPSWVVKRDKQHISERYGFLPNMNQLRGYDSGGYVQPFTAGSIGTSIDYDRLAGALATLRPPQPLYGDVHLQPHDYNQFRREMESDQRRASSDGVQR